MEFDNENLDGDFLCDLLTADNDNIVDASFLGKEARLDQLHTKNEILGKVNPLKSALTEITPNLSSACISSIHTGDTDSSDDDDNRNQLDSNLNSYGKSIKLILPKENQDSEGLYLEKRTSWKTKNDVVPTTTSTFYGTSARSACDDFVDPVFHIRISERLISTTTLQERMRGRLAISMDGLKRFTEAGDKETDWVVAGTIVFKSPVKTSQKGAKYSIWRLSDLKPGLKTASVFLFRSAFKDLWKTSIGTVVGILNPAIIDNRDGSGDEAALSVDLAQKVMVLGKSKDYGLCKSTKKNGEKCGVFVNKSACDVCVYHIQTEYRKCSRRSELQSTAPRTPTLRNKVLGKSEVFYAGKSFTSVATGRNRNHVSKDKGTLQRLNGTFSQPVLKRPFCSQDLVKTSSSKGDCKVGFLSKPIHSNVANVKTNVQETGPHLNALKSAGVKGDLLEKTALSRRVKHKPKPVECTFLAAESGIDNDELLKKKIPKMSFEKTVISTRLAVEASNNLIVNALDSTEAQEIKKSTEITEIKKVENGLVDDNVTKTQKSDFKALDTQIKRTSTSISNKAPKSGVEPNFLGLASRMGLGLNNKSAAPLTTRNELVKPSNSTQETRRSPERVLSRGEINLKMLNLKIVLPEEKKSSCSSEIATNLNKLKEKRNAEFEKKQLADAKLARSAKMAKIRLTSELSSQKQDSELSKSHLMTPKTNVLTNPKVDFSVLGNKAGSRVDPSPHSAPCLMPGNGFIDLNEPMSRNKRDSAKLTAMKFAKSHGGFKKTDPNATTRATDSVPAKRKREPSPNPTEEQSRAADKAVQMKFKELLETKSRHSGLLEAHDDKEKEDYFNKLEKKEQLEEKMMSTFEVKCKAVTCLECKYTSFSASEICKADGHALKSRDAMKRFFKCGDCGNRTVVLTRIPKTTCSKCRSSHWQRAAMMKERVAEAVPLSIRGAEEKYVGSHSGGNINLLVPMS